MDRNAQWALVSKNSKYMELLQEVAKRANMSLEDVVIVMGYYDEVLEEFLKAVQ